MGRQGRIIADDVPERVLTDELLTDGYGVSIRSGRNPETGHADIYTLPEPMDEEKLRLLATIIGSDDRDTESPASASGKSAKGGEEA